MNDTTGSWAAQAEIAIGGVSRKLAFATSVAELRAILDFVAGYPRTRMFTHAWCRLDSDECKDVLDLA
jgi:hypothetical protein